MHGKKEEVKLTDTKVGLMLNTKVENRCSTSFLDDSSTRQQHGEHREGNRKVEKEAQQDISEYFNRAKDSVSGKLSAGSLLNV